MSPGPRAGVDAARLAAAEERLHERTMAAAASAPGMSSRSLRRRLHEEDASFQQIVESGLSDRSRQHLADPERPIKEIAGVFGFADQASFCRAFRRWSGTTPTAYHAQSNPAN